MRAVTSFHSSQTLQLHNQFKYPPHIHTNDRHGSRHRAKYARPKTTSIFRHTKFVLKNTSTDEYRYAFPENLITDTVIENYLRTKKIPHEAVFPPFPSTGITQAPVPLPENSCIKLPEFISYYADWDEEKDVKKGESVADAFLHQAQVMEMLNCNPHPNIVQYHGCIAQDGMIQGICLAKHDMTLAERIHKAKKAKDTSFDAKSFLKGLESGISHLHGLGLVHNNIHRDNIQIDDGDESNPIIANLDICVSDGERKFVGGARDWVREGYWQENATKENGLYAQAKIREYLIQEGVLKE
ncbi:serine/threonine-protein kinase [Zalerion maritima]|uniref:Serine/threonine-protein kinase n=1 Tax=Zalerion maritima TaxID=339359 RepID=A0AAD5RMC0_9PEZI|nr:serine/threonine-protein kinase [Zalerion maritima]